MTKSRIGNYLSISRVKGLEHFVKQPLSAYELGDLMWPGHKMAKVNARAIVRSLLLGEYIEQAQPAADGQAKEGADTAQYKATEKAAPVLANPPWLCRYCTLDVTNSAKRLQHHPCEGCQAEHQTCRWCAKQLVRVTGEFPTYTIKVRGCPGTVEIQKRVESKKKKLQEAQGELTS